MSQEQKCRAKDPSTCRVHGTPSFAIPSAFVQQAASHQPNPVPFGAWSEKDTELFKTIHGSRLYGLAKPGSDEDYYVIVPTRRLAKKINASQSIVGVNDTTTVDFASFVELCHKGVPQALEAMFSRKSKSDFFEDYRQNYFASDPEVIHTYMKTLKSFSLSDKNREKSQRQALRLALNLEELLYTGRFNPTLSKGTAFKVTRLSQKPETQFFKELKKISPIEVDWDWSDAKHNS